MRHIADVVGKEGVFSLELRSLAVRRSLSLCFWEGKNLVMMVLTHCSRDVPVVRGIVSMVGQLLSVVSTDPTIVCCVGVRTAILLKPLIETQNGKLECSTLFVRNRCK